MKTLDVVMVPMLALLVFTTTLVVITLIADVWQIVAYWIGDFYRRRK